MLFTLEALIMGQYLLTTLSSGFNTVYFLGYRTKAARRRIGALVLSLVCLATFVQSLYFTLLLLLGGIASLERLLLNAGQWLIIGLLAMLGSLAISVLILRQVASPEKRNEE